MTREQYNNLDRESWLDTMNKLENLHEIHKMIFYFYMDNDEPLENIVQGNITMEFIKKSIEKTKEYIK